MVVLPQSGLIQFPVTSYHLPFTCGGIATIRPHAGFSGVSSPAAPATHHHHAEQDVACLKKHFTHFVMHWSLESVCEPMRCSNVEYMLYIFPLNRVGWNALLQKHDEIDMSFE